MLGIFPLSGRMTRDLSELSAGAARLSGGDLETEVPVRSRDEIGQLAGTFNRMTSDLRRNQQRLVAQERLSKELELSRQIQEELLPRIVGSFPFAEVKGVSIPAREVGGDFFNYFSVPGGDVAIVMGDVSGKGMPAALLMANLQATLKARMPHERNLAELAQHLDIEIDGSTPSESYVTLFVAILDHERLTLRYVNAGHNVQYAVRDGGLERLEAVGRPLGLLPGGRYTERSLELSPGDFLFLFTDGLTEAENARGEEFGTNRLEKLLLEAGADQPDHLLQRVEEAASRHRGETDVADDATMLALRVGAPQSAVVESEKKCPSRDSEEM
jgi:sigma-B regulation protein RsbU (phosphoserine phosphatase)